MEPRLGVMHAVLAIGFGILALVGAPVWACIIGLVVTIGCAIYAFTPTEI